MRYRVGTFREAGLEAKWKKTTRGKPYIVVRDPNAEATHQQKWWVCDRSMFAQMEDLGVKPGFFAATILGDIFSI